MKKEIFLSPRLRKPTLPFSHAVKAGGFVYTMGVGPMDPKTGTPIGKTIEEQTHATMTNLGNLLEDAGTSLENIVKATVFLSDIGNFPAFNAAYGAFFKSDPPARSVVETPGLAKPVFFGGILVMIEAVAILP